MTLPSAGGNLTQTDPDGAVAIYGPAHLFESHGAMTVSTQGTTGSTGSSTSSADVKDIQPNDPFTAPAPGGVSSSCTATETGLSGSTTITNGHLVLNDPNPDISGEPGEVVVTPPVNPAPGTEYSGVVRGERLLHHRSQRAALHGRLDHRQRRAHVPRGTHRRRRLDHRPVAMRCGRHVDQSGPGGERRRLLHRRGSGADRARLGGAEQRQRP